MVRPDAKTNPARPADRRPGKGLDLSAGADREWASIDVAFQGWLSSDDFDSKGAQLLRQIREGN